MNTQEMITKLDSIKKDIDELRNYISSEDENTAESNIKLAESNKAVSQALADIVDIREIVNDVPSADVIKVIRCKDCMHRDFCSIREEIFLDDECFCSLGKMKGAVND